MNAVYTQRCVNNSLSDKHVIIIEKILDSNKGLFVSLLTFALSIRQKPCGKIVKVCHESMRIPGSISDWEQWTGLKFFESGDYVIEGALNPVNIDLEKDLGIYIEPNIWMLHQL